MTTNTEVAGTSGSLDTSNVGVSSQRLTLALLMLLAGAVPVSYTHLTLPTILLV